MKNYLTILFAGIALLAFFAPPLGAFEIITREDIKQGIVVQADLIKTADNAIILFDGSSSMNKPYKGSGMTRYEIAKQTLMDRNEYFPDLGYNFGLYLHTPWKEVYPVQAYDRNKFAQALATLPEKPGGATFLREGLKRLDSILKPLEGRTAVFIYTDGSYTGGSPGMKSPADLAENLAKKYNVCFYIISTADDYYSSELLSRAYNFCSRVISFEDFIVNPLFNSEALFTVKATKHLVTLTDKRVVGIKTKPFLFDFDKIDLSGNVKERLSLLAAFLKENKNAFAAMAGHTDTMGPDAYNQGLSYRRVGAVSDYLIKTHDVNSDQLLMFWFGSLNPAADNATREGRMQNRRVEIVVGGI